MKHDKLVCEMVKCFIEKRGKDRFSESVFPDEEINREKAVDISFRGRDTKFVMEHTRIESIPEQILLEKKIKKYFSPLESELSGKLPLPGKYELVIKYSDFLGIKKKNINDFMRNIKAWITQTAPILEIGSPETVPHHFRRDTPQGIPFEVDLYRWPGGSGKFRVACHIENLEEKRRQRIEKAIDDKCPKLDTAKGKNGTSILVLESNDISLANYADIFRALQEVLSRKSDIIPDEVYLVETENKPWDLWIFKEGNKWHPDIVDYGPHEINLTNVKSF